MADPVDLYDAKGRKNFLAFGDYRVFLPYLSWTGPKQASVPKFLDSLLLRLQFYLRPNARPANAELWKKIKSGFSSPVQSMLLYRTEDARDTDHAGFIKTDYKNYFIRIFKRHEDLIYQSHQIRFVQEYFAGPFVTTAVVNFFKTILVQEFIRQKRRIDATDYVEKKIIHLSEQFLSRPGTKKFPRDIIPLDLPSVFTGDFDSLGKSIRAWVVRQTCMLHMVPIHGDMTPWNMFVDAEEKLILTCYERAGWHVPYYDYFHYLLQPKARNGRATPIDKIKFDVTYDYLLQAKALYLIDQLYHDIADYRFTSEKDAGLRKVIEIKTRWLRELI
ncbi:MAG: hypothetical protein JWM96_768 [Alphaproteobacteria bacterium]|nr:hypothetical protein [Alphaproteobacteria bacterium]